VGLELCPNIARLEWSWTCTSDVLAECLKSQFAILGLCAGCPKGPETGFSCAQTIGSFDVYPFTII